METRLPEIERIDGGDYVIGTRNCVSILVELGPLELWGATFFDWGGAEDVTDFHPRSFRASEDLDLRLALWSGAHSSGLCGGSPRCRCSQKTRELR